MTVHQFAPPRHAAADRTADALRQVRAEIAENILWIEEYSRALATCSMTGTYRLHIEHALARRLRSYREDLQAAHQFEQRAPQAAADFNRPHGWA